MKRPSSEHEPIPWEALARQALGYARAHRARGEESYARAEERLSRFCELQGMAERLRPGEPPIPGVTCDDETS